MEKLFSNDQILETVHFDAHQDWECPIVGFFIVAAKDESKKSITDFDDQQLIELAGILKKVRGAMRSVLGIQDVYLFQNEDTSHGFHLWLFPRHAWMEKFGRKIESVRPVLMASKEEFATEPYLSEVKGAARKVREFLSQ